MRLLVAILFILCCNPLTRMLWFVCVGGHPCQTETEFIDAEKSKEFCYLNGV